MTNPDYVLVRDPAEAMAARRALGSQARYVAGGTALQLAWPQGRADHPLIDIAGIDMGPAVSLVSGNCLRLAATATLEALREDGLLRKHASILATAITGIAALGVRQLATVGGNLAWGAGDLVPLFLALDAHVVCSQTDPLPIATWLPHRDDDLVLAIDIPLPVPELTMWEKIGRRASFSPSLITVAAAQIRGDAHARRSVRMAVGGGPVPPARLDASEARLSDARAGGFETLAAAISAGVRAPDDSAATGAYRAGAAGRVLASFLIDSEGWREAIP